jgi:hypothetical protein
MRQSLQQIGQHTFGIFQDVVVPVSHHVKAVGFQRGFARLVGKGVDVLSAIDFNDELSVEADEIEDVALEWHLPAEFDSVEAPVAQQEPQLPLGIGRVAPHRAGMTAQRCFHCLMAWRLVAHGPLTPPLRGDPLPQRERVIRACGPI